MSAIKDSGLTPEQIEKINCLRYTMAACGICKECQKIIEEKVQDIVRNI